MSELDIKESAKKRKKWPLFTFFALIFALGLAAGYVAFEKYMERGGQPPIAPVKPIPIEEDGEYSYLKIYYPITGRLQMEQRRVKKIISKQPIAEAVVGEFLKGPSGTGQSFIPPDTRLLGIYSGDNGILYVDLSEEFRSKFKGDALQEFLLLRGLYESLLTNVYGVEDVKLLIEGKEAETIGGHLSVLRPLGDAVSQTVEEN